MILGAGRRPMQQGQHDNHTQLSESDHDVDSDDETLPRVPQPDTEDDDEDLREPWTEWIRRVTHRIEQQARALNIESWITKAQALIWNLARRAATHSPDRWTNKALIFRPDWHYDGSYTRAHRQQARPRVRWEDDLSKFSQKCNGTSDWQTICNNSSDADWDEYCKCFCNADWRQHSTEPPPITSAGDALLAL